MRKLVTNIDSGGCSVVPPYFFFEGTCLVQGWLDGHVNGVSHVRSPSVQMFMNDKNVYLFEITEQFLSAESVHQGNESPPSYIEGDSGNALKRELLRQAGLVGAWLQAQGYRGTSSVDFLVLDRHGETETRVCEINARVTGATYPSVLAQHFYPGGGWVMHNIKLLHEISSDLLMALLNKHGHLYQRGMEQGVLPFNLYTCPESEHVEKGQLLCLGPDIKSCEALLRKAEKALPVDWEYGRD